MNEVCYSLSALQTVHDYNATYCNAVRDGEPCYPLASKRTLEVVAGLVEGVAFSAIALGLATLLGGFTTKLFQCTSFGDFVSTFFTEVYEERERFIPNVTTVWYNPNTEYVLWTNGGAIIRYLVPQLYYNGLVRTISSIFFLAISSLVTLANILGTADNDTPFKTLNHITQISVAAVAMRATTIAYVALAVIQTAFRTIPDMVSLALRVTHNPHWSFKNIAVVEFLYVKHVVLSYLESVAAIVVPEVLFYKEGIDCSKRMNDRNREIILLTEPEDFGAFDRFISDTGTLEQVTASFQQIHSLEAQPYWFNTDLKVKFLKRVFLSEPTTKEYIETILRTIDDASLQEFCRATNRAILIRAEQYALDPVLKTRLWSVYTDLAREEPNDFGAFEHFVTETGSLEQVVHLFKQLRALRSFPAWCDTDLKVKFLKRVLLSEPTTKAYIESILWAMDDGALKEFFRSVNQTIIIRAEQYAIEEVLLMRCRAIYNELQNNVAPITLLDIERITSKKITLRLTQKLIKLMQFQSLQDPFIQKCLNRYTTLESRWASIETSSTKPIPKSVILRTAIQIEKLALLPEHSGLKNIDKKIGTRRLIINWATKNVVIVSKRPKGLVINSNTSKICRPALLTPLDATQLDQTKKVAFIKSTRAAQYEHLQLEQEFCTHDLLQGERGAQGIAPLDFYGLVKTSVAGLEREQFIAVEKFYDFTLQDLLNSNQFKNMDRLPYAQYVLNILPQILNGIDTIHSKQFVHAGLSLSNVMINQDQNSTGNAAITSMGCTTRRPVNSYLLSPTTDPIMITNSEEYARDYTKMDIFSFGAILYTLSMNNLPNWSEYNNSTRQWTFSLDDLRTTRKKTEDFLEINPTQPYSYSKKLSFKNFLLYVSFLTTNPDPKERPTAKQLLTLLSNYKLNPTNCLMELPEELEAERNITRFTQQCATGAVDFNTIAQDPYFKALQEYVQNPKNTQTSNIFKKKAEENPEVSNLFLRLINTCLQDKFCCKNWEQSQAKTTLCTILNTPNIDHSNTKKLYRQFLLHFHPDKIDSNSKFIHETFAYMQHLYSEATKV